MYTSVKRTIEKELIPFSVITVSFFLLTALIRYAIVPFWSGASAVRNEVFRYKRLIKAKDEYVELKNIIREKHKDLEKKHTELTHGLGDPNDLSGLLQMIFDKAWESGIRFDKTLPKKEFRGPDYVHYPIMLEMTTTYNSLGKFIASLERMPQIVRVNRVAITSKNNELISVHILITCFLALKQ